MNLSFHPHRRFNPLTGEWILVSPHRTQRPWQGKVESDVPDKKPEYDPKCYLCPGNERAGGVHNPSYTSTFVFDNDFAALLPDTPPDQVNDEGLLIAQNESGCSRVICFSPRHDLTLALMDREAIEQVIDVWIAQFRELGALERIHYVQIFENRGDIMGCSNPHPHCQIWANQTVPMLPAIEGRKQKEYRAEKGSCLLCDYIALEVDRMERIVAENADFVALVPFWAVWPFEIMIAPKGHFRDIAEIDTKEKKNLADIVRRVCIRYDNLFTTSFPYSMGIHQRPTDGQDHEEWHFHLHFYPPLLRSATVKKFMVGYELLAQPQRDITAEQSAFKLRECSETHYTSKK